MVIGFKNEGTTVFGIKDSYSPIQGLSTQNLLEAMNEEVSDGYIPNSQFCTSDIVCFTPVGNVSLYNFSPFNYFRHSIDTVP